MDNVILPAPATAAEFYLNAIVLQLQRLNINIETWLAALAPEPASELLVPTVEETVELREPEAGKHGKRKSAE